MRERIEGVPDGLRIKRIVDLTHMEMGWLVEFEPDILTSEVLITADERIVVGGEAR